MNQLLSNNNHRRFIGSLIKQHYSFTPSVITSGLPLNLHQHRCISVPNESHGPTLYFPTVHDTSSSSPLSSGNKAASRWEQMFNLLTAYKQRKKDCNVPHKHLEEDENLGHWLNYQRQAYKKDKLNDEGKRQLEDLGVLWEVRSTWDDMFILLTQYKDNNGHCNVPNKHKEDDKNLGYWLNTQRQAKKKDKLNDERLRQLKDLSVVWESTKSWEDMFILLTQYKDNNGHCNVPHKHKEDGKNLGPWLNRQRQAKKKQTLNIEGKRQLEDLGVVWESTISWENMFVLLIKYKANNGHCNVPKVHKEDNKNLGHWLNKQRQAKKKQTLNTERKRQLEDLGVVWESTKSWDDMFLRLTQYKANNLHCKVPQVHKEDGENLGYWLKNQRQANKKGKLDNNKIRQLVDLGVERMYRW